MRGFIYTMMVIIFMLILTSVISITERHPQIQDDELNGDVLYLLGVDVGEETLTIGPPRDVSGWFPVAEAYARETGEEMPGPHACVKGLCFKRTDWTSKELYIEGRFEVIGGDCPINGTRVITEACTLRIRPY